MVMILLCCSWTRAEIHWDTLFKCAFRPNAWILSLQCVLRLPSDWLYEGCPRIFRRATSSKTRSARCRPAAENSWTALVSPVRWHLWKSPSTSLNLSFVRKCVKFVVKRQTLSVPSSKTCDTFWYDEQSPCTHPSVERLILSFRDNACHCRIFEAHTLVTCSRQIFRQLRFHILRWLTEKLLCRCSRESLWNFVCHTWLSFSMTTFHLSINHKEACQRPAVQHLSWAFYISQAIEVMLGSSRDPYEVLCQVPGQVMGQVSGSQKGKKPGTLKGWVLVRSQSHERTQNPSSFLYCLQSYFHAIVLAFSASLESRAKHFVLFSPLCNWRDSSWITICLLSRPAHFWRDEQSPPRPYPAPPIPSRAFCLATSLHNSWRINVCPVTFLLHRVTSPHHWWIFSAFLCADEAQASCIPEERMIRKGPHWWWLSNSSDSFRTPGQAMQSIWKDRSLLTTHGLPGHCGSTVSCDWILVFSVWESLAGMKVVTHFSGAGHQMVASPDPGMELHD